MNNHFWFGMAVILVSGALNAGFALPMKYSRIWKWENLWLVFSVVGIFSCPGRWLWDWCRDSRRFMPG